MSDKILCIETSDEICSVALSIGSEIFCLESEAPKSHGKVITLLIDKVMKNTGLNLNELEAIGVSSGPGSYTGLRIGISVAKGLCYTLEKPLISMDVFEILKESAIENDIVKNKKSFAMIDARRMEVYAKHWDVNGIQEGLAEALILNADFLEKYDLDEYAFFGSGAHKIRELNNDIVTHDLRPHARYMINKVQEKFKSQKFENTAYFEPFYLKEFYITKPKNQLKA